MTARLLDPDSSILSLIVELRYSLSRFQADSKASSCIPIFQPLRDECDVVLKQELKLQEDLSNAQAFVDIADENLDDFASRLSKAVLTITKDDRSHPLYIFFFNKKPLSTFIRPKLGAQFEAMKNWGDTLKSSPFPALSAMATELGDLIDAGEKALEGRATTNGQIRAFRDVGPRRQLFDKVNAARKDSDGTLSKLAIETPGLPTDYASRFFRSAPGDPTVAEPTIDSVGKDIADLEAKLAQAKDLLAKVQAAADEAKKAADDRAAALAQLSALEQQESDLKKQMDAIKEKLGQK